MPGPPPKPAAIRRRDGNPAKRPIPDEVRVGEMVVHELPAPAHLPAYVAAVWDEFVPDLVAIGLVRSIDATVLEALCRFVARAREADDIVDDEGFIVEGHRGQTVHPAARVSKDCWNAATKIASEYGMTAVGRLKVGAAVLQQKSLADELRGALDGTGDADVEGELAKVLDGKGE